MKAVFDEGVPRDLAALLRAEGCDVALFPKAWKGVKNGNLLVLIAQAGFDCLITCDKNLRQQQNLSKLTFGIVVLPSPKLKELEHLVDRIVLAVAAVKAGAAHLVDR